MYIIRLNVQDLSISSLPYACRLAISSEAELPIPTEIPTHAKMIRRKQRWSFYKKVLAIQINKIQYQNAIHSWRVDFTEVNTTTIENNTTEKNEQITYELEFEFNDDVILLCQSGDKIALRTIASQFWDFSVRFLNLLHKSGTSHFDPSLPLEKVFHPFLFYSNAPYRSKIVKHFTI
jgi:hypothetical protein